MSSNSDFPIKIYSSDDGSVQIDVRIDERTIWLSQNQLSTLFNVQKSAISKHIDNIYKEWELLKKWTVSKMETVQKEWKRMVKRKIDYYNLDMIISVWYRVNSRQATQFRIWATTILKNHIIQWYTLNQQRLSQQWTVDLMRSIAIIKRTLENQSLTGEESEWLLRLITQYIPSLVTLNTYDTDWFARIGKTTEAKYIATLDQATAVLHQLKQQLIKDNQATDLFALPKSESWLESILWAIYQWFDGNDVYFSVEEKAANLLYLIIKNHPFVDGNKRSWAFLFVWFLSNNWVLYDEFGTLKINQQTLVALALLVATSDPREKSLMIRLIMHLIS